MTKQAQRGEVLGEGHRANKSRNVGHDLGFLIALSVFVLFPHSCIQSRKDEEVMFWVLAVKKVLRE